MSDEFLYITLAIFLMLYCLTFTIGMDRMFFDSAGSVYIKDFLEMNNN